MWMLNVFVRCAVFMAMMRGMVSWLGVGVIKVWITWGYRYIRENVLESTSLFWMKKSFPYWVLSFNYVMIVQLTSSFHIAYVALLDSRHTWKFVPSVFQNVMMESSNFSFAPKFSISIDYTQPSVFLIEQGSSFIPREEETKAMFQPRKTEGYEEKWF